MRIIAGQFKSRQLKATPPAGTRPTSDKLRETLFNILGPSVRGCTFLDGCAGVGAIGIEAISRGAQLVVFVDQSRKAVRMTRDNLRALDIAEGFRILELDIGRSLELCAREGTVFDVAFIDPPYDRDDIYKDALERFGSRQLLRPAGVLVIEHSKRNDVPEAAGTLRRSRTVVQGDSTLSFYRPEAT